MKTEKCTKYKCTQLSNDMKEITCIASNPIKNKNTARDRKKALLGPPLITTLSQGNRYLDF